jgi:hypothetical protein
VLRFATIAVLALATLAIAPVGQAASQGNKTVSLRVENMNREQFLAYHSKLARDLETRKYEHVSNSSRDKIAESQAKIRQTLEGKASLEQLDSDERVRLFNAHEHVIAVLNDSELDRVVCKRQHQLGSHRPKLQCQTVREQQEIAAQQKLNNLKTRNCGSGESFTGG